MDYEHYYSQFLQQNPYQRFLYSHEPILGKASSVYIKRNGKTLLNFSSSDYLGLAKHPLLIARAQSYAAQFGVGTSASRLVTGNFSMYEALEAQLAAALHKPAALILGTGYQANMSLLESLLDHQVLGSEPLVFADKYCHTSMLIPSRFRARVQRFQHNNLDHLQTLLDKVAHVAQPKFILVESIYSMEGDQADLATLTRLAQQYQAFLYVDDAHGVGVSGPKGWGPTVAHAADIPVIMGTFSKALGSFGAYVGCSEQMRHYFINKCRGLIYSTALPPVIWGAISAAMELVPTLEKERAHLVLQATRVRKVFQQNGLNYGHSTTHIIPWILGDAPKTLRAAHLLEEQGILGVAIQPPSVPPGQSRIRFCLTAGHGETEIETLLEAIQKVEQQL